jgi:steroid delta-isomerase-like uncharacterized protein
MFRRVFALSSLFLLLMALSAAFVLQVGAQETSTDDEEAILLDIAQRYTDDIWNQQDLAAGETLFAEDFVDHHPIPGQLPGWEGYRDTVLLYYAAFPDLEVWNDDVFASGDRLAIRWTATGTHDGELLGIPASGNSVTITGIDILRVVDEQIAERWAEDNALELMGQIGAFGSS